MNLLIDNELSTTLDEFIEANTGEDVHPVDPEDIETIRELPVNGTHYIPVHAGWCEVKRTA